MNELYIARDGKGSVAIFEKPPKEICDSGFLLSSGWFMHLWSYELYPDLKPGECMRLVLAEGQ